LGINLSGGTEVASISQIPQGSIVTSSSEQLTKILEDINVKCTEFSETPSQKLLIFSDFQNFLKNHGNYFQPNEESIQTLNKLFHPHKIKEWHDKNAVDYALNSDIAQQFKQKLKDYNETEYPTYRTHGLMLALAKDAKHKEYLNEKDTKPNDVELNIKRAINREVGSMICGKICISILEKIQAHKKKNSYSSGSALVSELYYHLSQAVYHKMTFPTQLQFELLRASILQYAYQNTMNRFIELEVVENEHKYKAFKQLLISSYKLNENSNIDTNLLEKLKQLGFKV
jgi:hypothetical protein